MARVIGIDLGTTNSCVSILEGGEPVVLSNLEGKTITPSMIAFTPAGEVLIGQVAKRQAITNPENSIYSLKRLVGRSFDSEEVQHTKKIVPFNIVKMNNNEIGLKIGEKTHKIIDLYALILQRMKEIAEAYYGEPVEEAVITVPAYFDDNQRQATREAGKIAGLNVSRIINEPTAAALAYGLGKGRSQKIAVYDLGGGTFDISILDLSEGVFAVNATAGNTFLGGDDFDQRIIDWLANEFQQRESIDLRQDKMALQRLKEVAELAKCELSTTMQTEIHLPFITSDSRGAKHLEMVFRREKLEELTEDLIQKTLEPCQQALSDAGLIPEDIDGILLVGGQTRMPLIQQVVQDFFRKEPYRNINPDEVVSMGAAIQGGVLEGQVKDIILLDVTPLTLGVETFGGTFTKLVERNSTIPIEIQKEFTTVFDNQPTAVIHVLQGESPVAKDNRTLGRFALSGILPAARGIPRILVNFLIDANGILNVTAKDLTTGVENKIQISDFIGAGELEISQMALESKPSAAESATPSITDKSRIYNEAIRIMQTAKKTLDEGSGSMNPEERRPIEFTLEKLARAVRTKNTTQMRIHTQQLKAICARKEPDQLATTAPSSIMVSDDKAENLKIEPTSIFETDLTGFDDK